MSVTVVSCHVKASPGTKRGRWFWLGPAKPWAHPLANGCAEMLSTWPDAACAGRLAPCR